MKNWQNIYQSLPTNIKYPGMQDIFHLSITVTCHSKHWPFGYMYVNCNYFYFRSSTLAYWYYNFTKINFLFISIYMLHKCHRDKFVLNYYRSYIFIKCFTNLLNSKICSGNKVLHILFFIKFWKLTTFIMDLILLSTFYFSFKLITLNVIN